MRSPLSRYLTPTEPRSIRRFFRVRPSSESPRLRDHPVYFGLATAYFRQPFRPSTGWRVPPPQLQSMPVFCATVEKPAEKGRKTRTKLKTFKFVRKWLSALAYQLASGCQFRRPGLREEPVAHRRRAQSGSTDSLIGFSGDRSVSPIDRQTDRLTRRIYDGLRRNFFRRVPSVNGRREARPPGGRCAQKLKGP
jgi:hypothetical protein